MLSRFSRTCLLYGEEGRQRRDIPGSVAFVPAVAGLIMAGEVINDLRKAEGLRNL